MKIKIHFLLLIFLCPFFVLAQNNSDLVNKFDSKGRRHGPWEKYYSSGRLRYKGKFYHGKEVGDFYFYENKITETFLTEFDKKHRPEFLTQY